VDSQLKAPLARKRKAKREGRERGHQLRREEKRERTRRSKEEASEKRSVLRIKAAKSKEGNNKRLWCGSRNEGGCLRRLDWFCEPRGSRGENISFLDRWQ